MRKILTISLALLVLLGLTSCRESDITTYNVKRDADSFKVRRKLTVMNMRTDTIILELEGLFAISNNAANELQIIIQTDVDEYLLDYVYMNDWTMYVIEQTKGISENKYDYKIKFIPQMIVPVEVQLGE